MQTPEVFSNRINVTRPQLPPLSEYVQGLREIWDRAWLTNDGPMVNRFESELADFLGIDNVCLFNNGTLALQIALQGMEISGEVITTPFTFVATTHALFWNKVRPVFVDIDSDHYTLDPKRVEQAITPWTSAILAVHLYGHPCRHEELNNIARRHNIRLIYDAAHAFGVKVDGRPIGELGDLSMFSFHATKLFHSIEGGMLSFRDASLKRIFNYLKNFGFENEEEVVIPGTNAKMNELQALMGSLLLKRMPQIIDSRRVLYERYLRNLASIPGILLPTPLPRNVDYNYAYLPIEIDGENFGLSRDAIYEKLKEFNVFTRRYFYPLLSDLACYRHVHVVDPLVVARRVSSRILTLPIYPDLRVEDVDRICEILYYLHQTGVASCHKRHAFSAEPAAV